MSDLSVQINGKDVLIEAEPVFGAEYTGAEEVTVQRAQGAFERARETISEVSQSMVKTVRNFKRSTRPDEFSLEFGIKFKMDGSVVIASTSTEATLTVKMVYKNSSADNRTDTTSSDYNSPTTT